MKTIPHKHTRELKSAMLLMIKGLKGYKCYSCFISYQVFFTPEILKTSILHKFIVDVRIFNSELCILCNTEAFKVNLIGENYHSMMLSSVNAKTCISSPEYLINRKTHTCLAVLEGNTTIDAVIGMEKCNGKVNQQWHHVDSQWQWGGDRKLCLTHKAKGAVVLAPCDSSTSSWTYNDNGGSFSTGSLALGVRVGIPSQPVRLWQQKGGANQRWWTLTSMKKVMANAQLAEHCFPAEVIAICKKEMKRNSTHKSKKNHLRHCLSVVNANGKDGVCGIEDFEVVPSKISPEYFISQRNYKCLTVTAGSSAEDAIIGMAPFSGCEAQQWFLQEGLWCWGANCTLCLVPDSENGKVVLDKCSSALPGWNLDTSGLLLTGTSALEVHQEGEEFSVRLQPVNGNFNQKWWLLSSLKQYVGKKLYPFFPNDSPIYREELIRGLINSVSPLSEPLPYPRDVSHFPGAVAPSVPRVNRLITVDVQNLGRRKALCMRAPPQNWQATGLYVAAGDLFSIILPESTTEQEASQIRIRIGAHTDNLNPKVGKIKKGRKLRRMPAISEVFDLQPGANIFRSQYGGNLIFMLIGKHHFQITVEVMNVVETPHYLLNRTKQKDWESIKALRTPHSILEGNRVVLVVPTPAIKKIKDPETLLQRYDHVVSLIEDLSGLGENDLPPNGKHWLVEDIQISAGSAHAGFPTMFERRFYKLANLKTPHSWVVWHELGHNYQQPHHWSNVYGSESTVNLFSLYIQEKLKGFHRLMKNESFRKTAEAVDQGLTFESAKCGSKLAFLMEIQNAFPEKGWDMFRHLMRTTRALSDEDSSKVKSSKQNQLDYVYKILSQFIGVDLMPHYQRWGIRISNEAQNDISQLHLQKCSELAVRI
ncbi:hypothetical protein SK128_023755 [Halocaridina rubra]|uniref:Peptidase M60 domain-containing protein n=1 Tax=Halocaridina rubra TaxID=373956 RepID=A0AAN8XTN2_HALRR